MFNIWLQILDTHWLTEVSDPNNQRHYVSGQVPLCQICITAIFLVILSQMLAQCGSQSLCDLASFFFGPTVLPINGLLLAFAHSSDLKGKKVKKRDETIHHNKELQWERGKSYTESIFRAVKIEQKWPHPMQNIIRTRLD